MAGTPNLEADVEDDGGEGTGTPPPPNGQNWPDGPPAPNQPFCPFCGKWRSSEGRTFNAVGVNFHKSHCKLNPSKRGGVGPAQAAPTRPGGRTTQPQAPIRMNVQRDVSEVPAEEDEVRWDGHDYEEKMRTKRLEKILSVYATFLTAKEVSVVTEMWNTDQELRNNEREFYAFLTELAFFKRNQRIAMRVVDTVFHDAVLEEPEMDYRGRGGYNPSGGPPNPYSDPRGQPRQPGYDQYYSRGRGAAPPQGDYITREEMDRREREIREKEELKRQSEMKERELSDLRVEMARQSRDKPKSSDEDFFTKAQKLGLVGKQENEEVRLLREQMAKLQEKLEEKERTKETTAIIKDVTNQFAGMVSNLESQINDLKDEKKENGLKNEIKDMIDNKLGSQPKGRSDQAEVAITDITKNSDLKTKAIDKAVDLLKALIESGKPVNTSNLKTAGLTTEEIERLTKEGLV